MVDRSETRDLRDAIRDAGARIAYVYPNAELIVIAIKQVGSDVVLEWATTLPVNAEAREIINRLADQLKQEAS